ncbi:MAG: guanine deaminase [Rouxiella aceris]|uniref:guanine deaminase n=1 Tax=Rouxiella aceris TaxID=2703884 RepID=UPI00283DBC00|nr:guanine deaminase [Rouxiella aceris]MDR3434101.1 guanine deaminase [Rouxiella aceris]
MTLIVTRALCGNFFDISGIAEQAADIESKARYIENGMMLLNGGKIAWLGRREEGERMLADNHCAIPLDDYSDKLIVPGFIDTHIHYPQTEMIAAFGEQLLEWLENYTFPTEAQYHDIEYAQKMSQFFIHQLLNNGTTTALVFGTVHPQSVDALFTAAASLNMRLIAGKVMMDKNAPEALLETPEQSDRATRALIARWHNHQRLSYALTPRFVPTSSPELLEKVRQIKQDYPDIYLQTHLSENREEISWVKSLYPQHQRYLDVYHHHELTGARCVFAHCLHLEQEEWDCLSDTDSSIAFCPTSNLFLGSGLFDLKAVWQKKIRLGMGTDVGAGTTFNMLQTLAEAYKVGQLQHYRLSAFEAFYHATLGGARALHLDDKIGNFDAEKEADLVVLDPGATALQQLRAANSKTLAEKLFVLITLGDDRNIYRTLVDGKVVYQRNN